MEIKLKINCLTKIYFYCHHKTPQSKINDLWINKL